MEYYSAMKRNKLLIEVTAWMNPTSIVLSERAIFKRPYILYDSTCLLFHLFLAEEEERSEDKEVPPGVQTLLSKMWALAHTLHPLSPLPSPYVLGSLVSMS